MLSQWTKAVATAVRTLQCALFFIKRLDRPALTTMMIQPNNLQLEHSDGFVIATTALTNKKIKTTSPPSMKNYHKAFLQSPAFQMELWLLKTLGVVAPESVSRERLESVAAGDSSSFALWTTSHREKAIRSLSTTTTLSGQVLVVPETVSEIVVMRCCMPNGTPFCDTWWSIETTTATTSTTEGKALLQFGTAVQPAFRKTMMFWMTDPLHRLYSRILLASAQQTLQQQPPSQAFEETPKAQ